MQIKHPIQEPDSRADQRGEARLVEGECAFAISREALHEIDRSEQPRFVGGERSLPANVACNWRIRVSSDLRNTIGEDNTRLASRVNGSSERVQFLHRFLVRSGHEVIR